MPATKHHESGSIEVAREKLGLTQEAFAHALGIKLSRLQSWEHRRATLNMNHAELQRFRRLNAEVFDAWVRGDVANVRLQDRVSPRPDAARRSEGRGEGDDKVVHFADWWSRLQAVAS